MFSDPEIAFIRSQHLARLGTVSGDQQPDVAPVGFEFDGRDFYIGGHNLPASRKFKNIDQGNEKVALALDDLRSVDPWEPPSLRIYGRAEILRRNGRFGPGAYFRIIPEVSWSWNIVEPAFQAGRFVTHRIVHQPWTTTITSGC